MAIAVSIVEGNLNVQTQIANNRRGMEAELYDGALKGLAEVVLGYNWVEQTTPFGNNILHVHVGKPTQHRNKSKGFEMDSVNIEFIQAILNHDAGYSLLWKQNGNGDTPLHLSARFSQISAVQEFLSRVQGEDLARMLRITNKNKDTPLHDATRMESHPGVVKLLLEAAEPGDPLELNHVGETPLYLAAEFGADEELSIMLNYCNPSALNLSHKGPCGRTPLHAAILCQVKPAIIQKMMEIDRSVIRVQDDEGQTPLHFAASKKRSSKYLQMLLDYDDKTDSSVYIQDNEGRTAVHVATLEFNTEGVKKLLASCPDSIDIVDNKGQNVVHSAASLGCIDKLESFLELGYFEKLLNEKDKDGNTPLQILVATVPRLLEHIFFDKLGGVIKRHSFSRLSFNNQNLTAGDILCSKPNLHHHHIPYAGWSQTIPAGGRVRTNETHQRPKTGYVSDGICKEVFKLKQKAQYHLVVATLIAAVTFTAGFTLPGGVGQNPGKSLGLAVLSKKISFIGFFIFDYIAFIISVLAVISYFRMADERKFVYIHYLYKRGYVFTSVSLFGMIGAFLCAVYTMIPELHSHANVLFGITGLLILPSFCILFGMDKWLNWPEDTLSRVWAYVLKDAIS